MARKDQLWLQHNLYLKLFMFPPKYRQVFFKKTKIIKNASFKGLAMIFHAKITVHAEQHEEHRLIFVNVCQNGGEKHALYVICLV